MSDLINISDFSYARGLDLAKNHQSFTYLYGLSDFWQLLFQDTSSTNLMLETTSVQASDIYSTFLQLCTGLSISDIGPSASSQLQLVIISSALNLPKDNYVSDGVWNNGFATIKVDDYRGFSVGDSISLSSVLDVIRYSVGNGINVQPVSAGGVSYTIYGSNWNGTYTITNISLGGYITYYLATNPGPYTLGGKVSVTSTGIETYHVPNKIITTRFIANRAFLPTITLEEGVDYIINSDTLRISFAKSLASYGFPSRITTTGDTEYSLWFADVRYDEDLIYEQYPLLLGLTPPTISNEDYRNFLYGLYYVYMGGPSLSIVEKGINLILGVPLARNNELVLEVRPYLNTDQFLVITDLNSYITPAGIPPSVSVGDTLQVGDELSKWVEILDYKNAGAWWLAYAIDIPIELMPVVPSYPTMGDYGKWIMNSYLRYNTFLVKVNVTKAEFLGAQKFGSVPDLISRLKPPHTFPIYTYNIGYILASSGVQSSLVLNSLSIQRSKAITGNVITSKINTGVPGSVAGTGVSASFILGSIYLQHINNMPITQATLIANSLSVQRSKGMVGVQASIVPNSITAQRSIKLTSVQTYVTHGIVVRV
jgi:hypothetical protein